MFKMFLRMVSALLLEGKKRENGSRFWELNRKKKRFQEQIILGDL